MADLKRAKEEFVSDHSGSSLAEASLPAFVLPSVVLLHCALPRRWLPLTSGPLRFLLENALLVGPCLAVLTERATAETAIASCVLAIAISFTVNATRSLKQKDIKPSPMRALDDTFSAPTMSCLSLYRAGMLIMTNLAILAVDFPVFPRRFAKVESYGTGLMDVGTGSFVLCQGIMRGAALRSPGSSTSAPWRSVIKSSVPLIFIGGVRLLAVKSIEYQEHTSEYGVHWNFFITLAGVVILAKLAPVSERWELRGAAGLAITLLHQAGLQAGLGAVAMSAQRGPGLLSLNKEGLISLPGYFALHCLGWGLGGALRHLRLCAQRWGLPALTAFIATGLTCLWAAVLVTDGAMEAVSRRSCNAAYIFWVTAQNATVISIFVAAELTAKCRRQGSGQTPPFFELRLADALSGNMLLSFLAANLLTGAVNLTVDTLSTPDGAAVAVLGAYMLSISALAWGLMEAGVGVRDGIGGGGEGERVVAQDGVKRREFRSTADCK